MVNREITEKKYRYLMETDKKQREIVLELIGKSGIPGNAEIYGIRHLGVVQAYWDKEFPGMFRIVAFDLSLGLKPVFKGEGVRKHEVCVVLDQGFLTELLMADMKIYQIKAGKVFFRDFWLLSQNPLAELPKTLELDIPAKLYFPHKYNKNANFGIRLSHLPPINDYCLDSLKERACAKLEKWYNENYETEFELGEQLKVYCESDVAILMAAVLKFRKLFLGITKDMDVVKNSVTIAGVVMKVFRAKFLKERHIPIVPEGGFEKADTQSRIAVQYFEWLAHREGVKVRHALNGGEIKFRGYKVDCVIGAQKRIIEFQGPNGRCAEENLGRTEYKMDRLRESCKNFSVEEVWECDVKKQLKRNREMKRFFGGVPDEGPINPRDAYAGGRTMPFCLYAAASDNVEISMFDIISLYPFVNYNTPYPVGIPKIVQSQNYVVNWTEPEDVPYDGLLKVKVIPPKDLVHPLLSIHADNIDEERALLGTYTSNELRKALDLGYKVIRFYRAYHFEEFDSQLFKGAKYNIVLDYDNIRYNPGLRLIAKLGLNSLWGKFSMRNTLSKTEIVDNMERPGVVRVKYAKKAEFIKEHNVSNIILSLWTTSAARIKLYEYMEQVYRAKGCKLLYCDTDSLIFTHPRGVCPLKEGKFLGEMTREYADSDILEFVAAGPKQYSLKLRRKSDGHIWEKTKIRGISLDSSNRVCYEEFKKMVLDYAEGRKKRFYYRDRIRLTGDSKRARNTRNFFRRSPDLNKYYEEVESHVNEDKKPLSQVTPDVILNSFMHLQQSYRELNLLCEQMSIIVATYAYPKGKE
uniref:DNA-directed DNA polymerase n=1 Tax=Globodera pallida TaxID=36090 RepID=A0A183C555_GLOPA